MPRFHYRAWVRSCVFIGYQLLNDSKPVDSAYEANLIILLINKLKQTFSSQIWGFSTI